MKQGDPRSSILFNMVMDELLEETNEKQPGGTISPNIRVAAMAFADDLVLLEDSEVDMSLSISRTAEFLRARGTDINTRKSVTVSATVIQGKSVPRTRPVFRYGREYLPIVGVISTFRYLGHNISGQGIAKSSIHNLSEWLQRLGRAPLKPSQKMKILRTHLTPKLHHGFQVPSVSSAIHRAADRLIKHHVKSWLHLSTHTGDQRLGYSMPPIHDSLDSVPPPTATSSVWGPSGRGCPRNSVGKEADQED